MPKVPKDSRLIGWGRVKPRLQRLPKRPAIPEGLTLAQDERGVKLAYNPPSSSPNPLITPTPFLPPHLQHLSRPDITNHLPRPLDPIKQTAKLNESQVEQVRAMRADGVGVNAIAKQFNVSTIFVSLVAPLPKEKREELRVAAEEGKKSWSDRKRMYSDIRKQRRAAWGT